MLGVPAATLDDYGAVSRQTAEAMAKGALAQRRPISRYRSPASPGPAAAPGKAGRARAFRRRLARGR